MKRTPTYVVLVTVLLSGCLLFIGNWTDAAERKWLSFASNRSGNLDIYIMDTNREGLRRLTTNLVPKNNSGPPWPPDLTWSPDGRFLAYTSHGDEARKTYVMDTRTREHWRLTNSDERELFPAWAPDGKWIAYVAGDAERSRIYKTDVNGAHPVALTDPGYYGRPAWSPDGKQIAFSLHIPQVERYHLCVIDVDGDNFRQLTQGGPIVKPPIADQQKPVNVPLPPFSLPEIYSPAWSPDGKQIAYVYSDTILGQTADIYIIDAKGKDRGTPLVKERGVDVSPAWVPEGFLSVSPSAEKQTTLWGRLKQIDN